MDYPRLECNLHPFFASKCTTFVIVKLIFMSFEMSKCNFELLRKLLNSLKLLETFQILNIKCWKHSSQSEGDGNLVLSNFHICQRIPIETLELNTEFESPISTYTENIWQHFNKTALF